MNAKRDTPPPEPTHECCAEAKREVAHYQGAWRYDCDDGLCGTQITYCPFCGVKL